jgi:hypothetical protein
VVTMFDSRTSCDNLWRVGHYSVAAANRWWDENVVRQGRIRADWNVSGGHSEATDVISHVTCALYDAISIQVGIAATGHSVQGLGFDFGRRTSGVPVTVLAEGILSVVLVAGGCDYRARGRHCLHIQQRNLTVRQRETKNAVFWDVAPCEFYTNRRFGGTYCFHLQGRKIH